MKVKTEVSGLLRDIETNALLNSDKGKLQAYKIAKKKQQEADELRKKNDQMQESINKINEQIAELRNMMAMMVEQRISNDNNRS